jgi:hypothetical protein
LFGKATGMSKTFSKLLYHYLNEALLERELKRPVKDCLLAKIPDGWLSFQIRTDESVGQQVKEIMESLIGPAND